MLDEEDYEAPRLYGGCMSSTKSSCKNGEFPWTKPASRNVSTDSAMVRSLDGLSGLPPERHPASSAIAARICLPRLWQAAANATCEEAPRLRRGCPD